MTDSRDPLPENETYISRDDLDLSVMYADDKVYVEIVGFEDSDEAEDYANHLAEVLPLLLFESTQVQ